MPVTDDQWNRALRRITKLETLVSDMLVAMDRFVTLTQVQQLTAINQTDIEELSSTIAALESRVNDLEAEPIS